jgi:hypothetical protein
MKKIVVLSLVVALMATGLFFFFTRERKNAATPATFISEDVLVCFTQKDLGRMLDDFKKSRLGKTFAQIDFVKVAEDMGLPQENILFLKKGLDETNDFLKSPIFKEIFNNEFTVALFPMDMSSFEKPVGNIQEHLLLIAKPEHGTQLINLLTSGIVKVVNQTSVPYGNYTIKLFRLEKGETLAAIAVQDLVLIAFDERIIQDSLDRYDKKKRSLNDNEGFQKLRPMFKDSASFSYFGTESLQKQMEMLLEKTDLKQKNLLKEAWRKWSGLQAAGYGVWREADKIRDKGVFVVDNAKLDPALRDFYATPSEKNTSLAIVPQHVLAYYWTNTMDFPTYWKMYLQGSGFSQQKIDAIRKGSKRHFGMDIETILGLLDKQCGLMVQDGEGKRSLPVPDFSMFVRLKDSYQLSGLARNFLKNNGLQVQTQDYKGVQISSMAAFSQGGLMPVYLIHNQYLVVASSVVMIKQIIDTMKEGHGLADNPRFQKVSAGLLDENNSVGYLRVGEMMHAVKGIVGWGRAIIAIQDRGGAKKAEIVIDRLVNPLLDGLSMYSDFGLRSRINPNQIFVESTTVVEH